MRAIIYAKLAVAGAGILLFWAFYLIVAFS